MCRDPIPELAESSSSDSQRVIDPGRSTTVLTGGPGHHLGLGRARAGRPPGELALSTAARRRARRRGARRVREGPGPAPRPQGRAVRLGHAHRESRGESPPRCERSPSSPRRKPAGSRAVAVCLVVTLGVCVPGLGSPAVPCFLGDRCAVAVATIQLARRHHEASPDWFESATVTVRGVTSRDEPAGGCVREQGRHTRLGLVHGGCPGVGAPGGNQRFNRGRTCLARSPDGRRDQRRYRTRGVTPWQDGGLGCVVEAPLCFPCSKRAISGKNDLDRST